MQTAVTVLFDHDPRDGAGLPELVTTLVNDAKRMGLTCAEEYVGEKWWEDVEEFVGEVNDPVEEGEEAEQAAVLTVTFASAAAAKLADAENLTDADFEGVEPGGAGGYVKSDVQAIIDARG